MTAKQMSFTQSWTRQPRDYQIPAVQEVLRMANSEERSLLLSAPPGSGKGDTIAMIISAYLARGKRVLFLVHKRELMLDIRQRLLAYYGVSVRDTGLLYRNRWQINAQAVFSTQGTAYRRLERVDLSQFDLCIVDEAHRTGARTYQEIMDQIGDHTKLIGFTATPWREDNVVLSNFYQRTQWLLTMDDALDRGYIVPTIPYAPVDVDLTGVSSRRGEFVQADLDRAFLPYDHIVLEKWQALGENRKTIIFCNSVEQARRLQAVFSEAGVPTGMVYHGMKNRDRVLDAFERNQLKVLLNIQIFSEGYDDPATSCIVWATATMSKLKYVQATMRGVRSHPGKKDCIVIDLGSNTHRHGCVEDYTEAEPTSVTPCPSCKFVMKATATICPGCGEEFASLNDREGAGSDGPREELEQDDPGELMRVTRMTLEERIVHRYTQQDGRYDKNEDLVVIAERFGWRADEVFRHIALDGRGSDRLVALFVDRTNKVRWVAYYLRAIERLKDRGLHYALDHKNGEYYFTKTDDDGSEG